MGKRKTHGVKGNGRGLDTQFWRRLGHLKLGKLEKLKERGLLSLGSHNVWIPDQSRTRLNGFLRFPIQEAAMDHPDLHTEPCTSGPPPPQGTEPVSCLVHSWTLFWLKQSVPFAQALF